MITITIVLKMTLQIWRKRMTENKNYMVTLVTN